MPHDGVEKEYRALGEYVGRKMRPEKRLYFVGRISGGSLVGKRSGTVGLRARRMEI